MVPGRVRKGDVVRAKNNLVKDGNGGRFQGIRKWKQKTYCFVVVKFERIFGHPCFYVICARIGLFGEVGDLTERNGFLELCVVREKLMIYRVVSHDIGERCMYRMKRTSPSTDP